MTPLSRWYRPLVALAIALGGVSLWAHLRQPRYPPAPGLGCIVTQFPSPDSLHTPAAFLELQSCPHISETILSLSLTSPVYRYPIPIFTAIGPEDPRAWAKALRLSWRGLDTVEVAFSDEVRFEQREDSARSVHVRYRHDSALP